MFRLTTRQTVDDEVTSKDRMDGAKERIKERMKDSTRSNESSQIRQRGGSWRRKLEFGWF